MVQLHQRQSKTFWHLSLWTLKENIPLLHEMELHEFLACCLDKGKSSDRKDLSLILLSL